MRNHDTRKPGDTNTAYEPTFLTATEDGEQEHEYKRESDERRQESSHHLSPPEPPAHLFHHPPAPSSSSSAAAAASPLIASLRKRNLRLTGTRNRDVQLTEMSALTAPSSLSALSSHLMTTTSSNVYEIQTLEGTFGGTKAINSDDNKNVTSIEGSVVRKEIESSKNKLVPFSQPSISYTPIGEFPPLHEIISPKIRAELSSHASYTVDEDAGVKEGSSSVYIKGGLIEEFNSSSIVVEANNGDSLVERGCFSLPIELSPMKKRVGIAQV